MLIVVGNPKGGCGKTTVAVNLAILLLNANQGKVMLIDADNQGSSAAFVHTRITEQGINDLICPSIYDNSIVPQIKNFQKNYNYIVVDTGGQDSDVVRSLLFNADILVMPILPSSIDTDAFKKYYPVLEAIKGSNPKLKIFYLINMADTNPRINFTESEEHIISSYPVGKLLKTRIARRIAFRRSMAEGLAITELGTKDDKAIDEMINLYKEIFYDV